MENKNKKENKNDKDDANKINNETLENKTINYDNHDKHQDNELKNLQSQTAKLREELKDQEDNESEKRNDKIRQPTDSEKLIHLDNSKNDKLPIEPERIETLAVVINQTIASLASNADYQPLSSVPLSGYAFGSLSTTQKGEFSVTPFRLTNKIPNLFKYKATFNADQQVNVNDMVITQFSSSGVLNVVSKSIELFNISTMTVRVELNEDFGFSGVIDPNSLDEGSIKLQTLLPSSRVDPQRSVNFVENRLFSVVTAFRSLNDVLITMPRKITCLDAVRGGPLAEELSRMPFYEELLPHPYYAIFSNLPKWAKDELLSSYLTSGFQIGDTEVDSYYGMKLSQWNKLVIDQYTAEILRLNFDKIRNHTLTTDRLRDLIQASMFKYDKIEIVELIDLADLSLLYNYTNTEYNLTMFNILTSVQAKIDITNFLMQELPKTNRLGAARIDEVWKGIQMSDIYSSSFNNGWLQSLHVGSEVTPYEMLIYETFSEFFDFSPEFGPLPGSLNAVTEILSIYVFMMLYPRITQRMIHKLGYRLSRLYDTVYPKVYSAFKLRYGDVRTNFGRNKFEGYGKQLTATDSQNGYIYSIFHSVQAVPGPGADTANLNKFIRLINDMRMRIMPNMEKINLNKKRQAGYPYLFDAYTTELSWKQLDYTDYNSNTETELGLKLKNLILTANTFRELYNLENPDSSAIPRAFQTYYSAWTTQLSSMIATAGVPYQITCAMMQETLFNSPFYIGSTYNPEKFFYVPPNIGIGPLESASLNAIIVPPKIRVSKFRIPVAMSLALTIEGEYIRNVMIPNAELEDAQQNFTRIRKDIGPLSGLDCFKMMNKLVCTARNFGYAMQFTQWLTTPKDPNNPFSEIMEQVSQYMRMSSWVPLVKKIFAYFGVDFQEYFTHTISQNSLIVDGRYLDRTLVLVDPETGAAFADQPLNTYFGRKFTYIIDNDINKIGILTRPLLSLSSPVIYVVKDWYFGRLFVEEMGPTQLSLGTTNWTDETNYDLDFSIVKVGLKNGQASQLTYRSTVDGMLKTIILPYSAANSPILLVNINKFEELETMFLRDLAKAVSIGKLIFRVRDFAIRVFIEDAPSRTTDYSIPHMSEEETFDILSMPTGCILDWTFKTTNYATNFSSKAAVMPAYIQWFATRNPADKNLFMSSITNAPIKIPQARLPSADELGYGPDQHGKKFNDGTLKTESNVINWNNCIPTVTDKLINSIEVNLRPWIPQYS